MNDFVIMRKHGRGASWPLTLDNLGLILSGFVSTSGFIGKSGVTPSWRFPIDIETFALDEAKATLAAIEKRQRTRGLLPGCEHSIARLADLRFDVWIVDFYGGYVHVQCESKPWHEATGVFLAAYGLACFVDRYLQANGWVSDPIIHAEDWKKRVDEIDIAKGQFYPTESRKRAKS